VALPGLVALVSARPPDGDPHPTASEEKAITSMPAPDRDITVAVDTHKDLHVAVALDGLGRRLGEFVAPATAAGYRQLHRWASDLGTVQAFGVEGTVPTAPGWPGTCAAPAPRSSRSTAPTAAPATARASPTLSTPSPPPGPCWPAPPPRPPSTATTGGGHSAAQS